MLVGIDLGTTNSLVACFRDGKADVIPNRLGNLLTPSVVAVNEDGLVLVGETAKEYSLLHPLNSARTFKRAMGTTRKYKLGGQSFSPEELSGLVLRSLKEDAENYLGCEVDEAIISVPAYFNDFQRKATKRAGELAGLSVSRIINEPTAAALAYGVGTDKKEETCLVFDLGGGTFDVSILEFYGSIMEVHAIAGDNFIGGEDFTELLADMFLKKAAIAPESLDEKTRGRVKKSAEVCKCLFSEDSEPVMNCVIDGETIEQKISLKEYEKACEPLVEKLRRPVERALHDAGFKLNEIDRVLLVGGATRLPVVRSFVIHAFKFFPDYAVDPDTAIAVGAAVTCGMKARDKEIEEVVLTDVCPFTLGTEVCVDNGTFEEHGHYLPIIERNTVIPVSRSHILCTANDNQTRVNIRVLQGESRMAANNLLLGEIAVPVPPGPKGEESVTVTYTYDVNSLLEVEVCVNSTGVKRKTIIQDKEHELTPEEAEARLAKLAYLKQNPRDDEANRLVILRGERLYEESFAEDRIRIDRALTNFNQVLNRQDRNEIKRAREALNKLLDELEFL